MLAYLQHTALQPLTLNNLPRLGSGASNLSLQPLHARYRLSGHFTSSASIRKLKCCTQTEAWPTTSMCCASSWILLRSSYCCKLHLSHVQDIQVCALLRAQQHIPGPRKVVGNIAGASLRAATLSSVIAGEGVHPHASRLAVRAHQSTQRAMIMRRMRLINCFLHSRMCDVSCATHEPGIY